MYFSTVAGLSERPRKRVLRITALACAALALSWLADAGLDAVVFERQGWATAFFPTSGSELWMRLVMAALVVVALELRRRTRLLRAFRSAVEEAHDGIVIADLFGYVEYANRAALKLYGLKEDELCGSHVSALEAHPEAASSVLLPELRQTGHWAGELEAKRKDGGTFPVWLTTALVTDRWGTPFAGVGILRDVTARRRTEQELRSHAARLEEVTRLKDLFADILRHDLMNPAAALRMSIERLSRRESSPDTAQVLGNMKRICTRLIYLLENASKYAKISALESVEMEPLDLREVLEEVVADFEAHCREHGARVALSAPARCPMYSNRFVSEVFANLLSNALKYGPADGTIAVDVKDTGEQWAVAVADRGEGVPDGDKQRIFTRFERLAQEGVKGSGLGLAIAKHVVEMHGGSIWVEDNRGGGSVFQVILPKSRPAGEAASRGTA